MDLAAVKQILANIQYQAAYQAFLLTANEDGYTVREIARQIGVPKSTLHRWLTAARDKRRRDPAAELVYAPAGAPKPCNHPRAFFMGRRRICLDCELSNFERLLADQRKTDEAERRARVRPPRKFRPKGRKTAEAEAS